MHKYTTPPPRRTDLDNVGKACGRAVLTYNIHRKVLIRATATAVVAQASNTTPSPTFDIPPGSQGASMAGPRRHLDDAGEKGVAAVRNYVVGSVGVGSSIVTQSAVVAFPPTLDSASISHGTGETITPRHPGEFAGIADCGTRFATPGSGGTGGIVPVAPSAAVVTAAGEGQGENHDCKN